MRNYLQRIISKCPVNYIWFITFCFVFFTCEGFSQASVSNTFTYGNTTSTNTSIHRCESTLNLMISWQNAIANDSLVLYFPNSFEVAGLTNASILDSLSEIVGVSMPVNPNGTLNLQFTYTGCYNQFAATNASLNTDNFAFQSYLRSNSSGSSYTFNGSSMQLSSGNPARVNFSTIMPSFAITALSNGANFNGNANQIYQRRFSVSVNSSAIDSFLLNINQEADLQHLSLRIIDNNSSNGNSAPFLINNDTCATSLNIPINLNALLNFYAQPNNEIRVLLFEQSVKLRCYQPNEQTNIQIIRSCCPTNIVYSAALNGKIGADQHFSVTSAKVYSADLTKNSCGGSYYYDLSLSKTGSIALIDSIQLPFNGNIITNIDSVYLIDAQNNRHALNGATWNSFVDNFSNRLLMVNLFDAYNTLSNWSGFQANANNSISNNVTDCSFIDSSWTPVTGPWLNASSFALRIKFDYNCKSQQNCGSPILNLQGLTSNGANGQMLPAPIHLYWRNSCESNELSILSNPNIPQQNAATSLDGFVALDHEMEPDQVSYTFYPPTINPFTVNNFPSLPNISADLSCDTSISYRAKFYIPIPDEAPDTLQRIYFQIADLNVGSNSIPSDSINFLNDSILYIPLGQDLVANQPIDFNFNYQLTACPFPDPLNSGGIRLICEIEAFCDHCAECYKTIGCKLLNVVVHCPGECEGSVPMSTKEVQIERSTFGFKSLNQFPNNPILSKAEFTQVIDSIINFVNPSISQVQRELILASELGKLYPFDIAKLTSKGSIQSYLNLSNATTNERFRFENISFELAHTPIGNQPLFALKQATLTFIDTLNNISLSAPLVMKNINPVNTEVFGMSGDTLFSFELAIDSLANFPMLLDTIQPFTYSLQLNAELWTLPDIANPVNPIVIRGQFVCSTNVNEQITKYSCDPWGAPLRVLVPQNDLSLFVQPDTLSYCKTNATIAVNLQGGFGNAIDDFQYEFRPLVAYTDTAFSTQFLGGYAVQTPSDTVFFNADTNVNLWNNATPNAPFLRAIEKPDSQQIFLSGLRYCASDGDTIQYTLPIYHFAYLTEKHHINDQFVPLHLTSAEPIMLNAYGFYNSLDSNLYSQSEIQSLNEPVWNYPSANPFQNLFPGLPTASQIQGIANADTLEFAFHLKAPDAREMGNCWLSYQFNSNTLNAPPIDVITRPYSSSLNYLSASVALDTLDSYYHFFPNGFPTDSLSTVLKMPVECQVANYKLKLKYGCFCDTSDYLYFKVHPDSAPSCVEDSSIISFQRNNPEVNLTSNLIVTNNESSCGLIWNVQVDNLPQSPSLTDGRLLINIPTGLVLNTNESTFQYFEDNTTTASSVGNYILGDTLPPDNYTFQFEDFPTPPTTVLVLAFPSIDTLAAGGTLEFMLKFKLDQSTCNLDSTYFQNNFLYRVLEARFTGKPICSDSIYASDFVLQDFIDYSTPTLQSQITSMTYSADCCLPSAVTVSIKQSCADSANGLIEFHFSSDSTGNSVNLYRIDDVTNASTLVVDTTAQDTLFSSAQPVGLYSATVTTSGGLIYVFNGLQIRNHGVEAFIHVIQDSPCSGSLIQLTAGDSNAVNNNPFNASNPFVATSPLTQPALQFYWLNTSLAVDTVNNYLASATPLTDSTYKVVVKHLSGCQDTASILVDVIPSVQAVITGIPNEICALNSYELNLYPSLGNLIINGMLMDSTYLYPGEFASDTLVIQYIPDASIQCPVDTTIIVIKNDNLCNCQPCINASNILEIPNWIEKTSQITDSLLAGATEISNTCVIINHNIEVDNDFSFSGCNITLAGGVEIIITEKLYLKSDTLQGCEQMWKGIHNFKKLEMNQCIIQDAHFGVELARTQQVAYSQILSSQFMRNFVGIKSADNDGLHNLKINNVRFTGDDLIQTYPNQTPIPLTRSLAGIVITNGFYISLDQTVSFTELCNGLILNNKCIAHIKRSTFNNISPFGLTYEGSAYWLAEPMAPGNFTVTTQNGNGIYANKGCSIFYTGYGGILTSFTSFQSCFRSILVDASNLFVENTKVNGGRFGFTARFMRGYKLWVNESYLNNNLKCIDLQMTDHIVNATIRSCVLTTPTLQTSNPNFVRRGLEISNYAIADKHFILNNDITSNNAIYLIGAAYVNILNNKVYGLGQNGIGINGFKSHNANFKCNIITGNSLLESTNQKAFSLASSSKCIISNNTTSNTRYGFEFNLVCTTDSFKLNTINNHRIGVRIPSTGMLGIQNNNGNLWNGNYSIASGNTGAWAQINPDQNSPHSRFVVHVGQPPFYPSTIYPITGNCQGTFFKCTAPFAPTAPINCNPVGNFSPTDDPNDENIRMLAALAADTTYLFDEFNESVKYQLRREVELALSQGQITLPDTGSFTNFEQQLSNGTESQYNAVDFKLQQRILQENADSVLRSLYLSIQLLSKELYQLDSALAADTNVTDSLLLHQITQGKQQLSLLNQQAQLITNQANDNYRAETAESATLNQAISNTAFYQEPEKTINDIYLRTIGSEKYTLTEDQIQTIHAIAHMCPAVGGSAVYKARSLYALINDTVSYDDANICLQQGVLYRLAQNSDKEQQNENVIIYPNPSTDFITIKYLGKELKSIELEITNATGQLVTSKIVNLSGNVATENISDLPKGVYFIRISNTSSGVNRTLKLVKF